MQTECQMCNLKEKHCPSLISQDKVVKQFEFNTMLELSEGITQKLMNKQFPKPSPQLLSSNREKRLISDETISTDESCEKQLEPFQKNKKGFFYDKLIAERVSRDEKKIQQILNFFRKFDELISNNLKTSKTEKFSSCLFYNLGKSLENDQKIFEQYSMFKLACSLTYCTWVECGIQPQFFIFSLNKIIPTKYRRISDLQKKNWFRRIIKFMMSQ